MEQGKGIIGIATAFLGRYREFDVCVNKVQAPKGTDIVWNMGVNIAHHYNNMVREMLKDDEFQWIWILGDDHTFPSDLLVKLLDRNVDIVIPLCLRRKARFPPVLHSNAEAGYKPLGFDVLNGKSGLVDITQITAGNAGMLIRRNVCETMDEPWFENGKTNPEMGGCDLWFCEKARKAGFKIWLDTDNTIGHLTHVAVYPYRDENNIYGPDIRTP